MADSERIGPYRVIKRLGAGGMGEVVLAHDDRLDRLVAIKRLHVDHAATPDRRERFRREARIAARLNHPAIVQIHDVLHEDDHDYLIMEYIAGRTLRERCAAGPMTVSEVLAIAHQIALGMATAHDLGVIHRDLKAENTLITPAGRAKITDFGIAKLHGEDTITADGAVVGTFRAMSPEQALGRAVDHRSDLFSFGILLYEALTGVSPFRADTPFLIVQRLVGDEPQPIAQLVPSIPAGLASLIHQLLAKEPLLRPRDFHEVAAALIELTGEACDDPCQGGSSPGGEPPSSGDETDDSSSPAGPRPARAASTARDSGREPAMPSGTPLSALAETVDSGASALPQVAPRRRLWSAAAAAAGLAVIGALGVGFAMRGGDRSGASPRAPLIRVAVLAPSVSGADGRPDVALLATAVRNAVMTGVRARGGLDLVPQADIDSYVEGFKQGKGSPPGQRMIRTAVGADEVIATHIKCVPSSCNITIERDANSSSIPPPASFQLAADRAGHPGDTVAVHLSRIYPGHPVLAAARAGSIDPRDHERYARLVQDYWAGGTTSTGELLVELEDIRERSPRSLDVLLFEAEVYRNQYRQTQDPDQARRAIALLRGADELFPDTYAILSARFDIVLEVGQLDDASAVLDQLAVLDPDSSVTHLQRAKLHYKRGELERARDALDHAARRDSFYWRVLLYQALVSKALGDRVATRAAIDKLLERSPANYAGLSMLAREELDAGRQACAAQIYARLVVRKPFYQEYVQLGITLNQLGRYREAADSFHRALAAQPAGTEALLSLAESLLFAKDTVAARKQLRELHDILARKRRNSPTGALEGDDLLVEAQTLAYLGLDTSALATEARTRTAELLTAARPGALYTAALVHAVLGDRALAAEHVTKYLDAGGHPAEFRSPWFEDLRQDPVLGPRLAIPPVAPSCEAPAP